MATFAVVIAAIALSAWTLMRQVRVLEPLPPPQAPAGPPAHTPENCLALRYARAVQDGNCEIVIPHTHWMRERLKAILAGAEKGAEDRVRGELCDKIQYRPAEGNQLRKEGAEDQYVFAPGATFEWVSEDAGRTDLDAPVRRRTWIRVVFPVRSRALSDLKGRPIRSMVVGVNVSVGETVLKASVVGNLEIDYGSFRYDWPSPQAIGG
ncbi:MAG: hypothetical protein HZB26_06945 [Candidatus Hydrogenedentes bacterium]|nr:hypothetical protein [Candidatus Hydrogenedentota bacterium]